MSKSDYSYRKDQSLDELATDYNVAQFVSFSPGNTPKQQFSRIIGHQPNKRFSTAQEALEILLNSSLEKSINIRSFKPTSPQGHEYVYGVTSLDMAWSTVERLNCQGLHVIASETADIHDGGVAGVVLGDSIEFAPDDTGRCVERPGVASFPRKLGLAILTIVYGFRPNIDVESAYRLEFSIHPKKRGWKKTNLLVWEQEKVDAPAIAAKVRWPNRFSRLLGDKVFGLLVADQLGLLVPKTLVFNRRIAPFQFGSPTGNTEVWLRTCPMEQVPGTFSTVSGWVDPFLLMSREDPQGTAISSVIAQSAVSSRYSGAAILGAAGKLIVEGTSGTGERFMRGQVGPQALPLQIVKDVTTVHTTATELLGPVRFEWVHDGDRAWIVQLHLGATESDFEVIVPGAASRWVEFDVQQGLDALRESITTLPKDSGLLLKGEIGLTSHIADTLRKAAIPARMARGQL